MLCGTSAIGMGLLNGGWCGEARVSYTGDDGAEYSQTMGYKVQVPNAAQQSAGFCPVVELSEPPKLPTIGLINKLRAYELQDQGDDTIEANAKLGFAPDIRDYGTGSQILRDLGVRKIRLMTNNPAKFVAIEGFGLEIVERVPLEIAPSTTTQKYLETKKQKLGHILELV